MSKKKQIEEMAKAIDSEYDCIIPCQECSYYSYKNCMDVKSAEKLYNAGYRKSEWISVDERLPEESGKYLVCIKSGNVYQTKFYSYPKDKGGHWGQKDKGKNITHWMPLPEAPKGGAE